MRGDLLANSQQLFFSIPLPLVLQLFCDASQSKIWLGDFLFSPYIVLAVTVTLFRRHWLQDPGLLPKTLAAQNGREKNRLKKQKILFRLFVGENKKKKFKRKMYASVIMFRSFFCRMTSSFSCLGTWTDLYAGLCGEKGEKRGQMGGLRL